jgi:transposase InsO family protein
VVVSGLEELNRRLAVWERFYNFERPHGGLDGQTPYERLRQCLTTPWSVTDVS